MIVASIWDITIKREAEEKLRHAAPVRRAHRAGQPRPAVRPVADRACARRSSRAAVRGAGVWTWTISSRSTIGSVTTPVMRCFARSRREFEPVCERVTCPHASAATNSVALLPQVAGVEGAKAVADRVAEFLNRPHEIAGTTPYCPASIGILLVDNTYRDASAVLRDADAAMYKAKQKQVGKSRDAGLQSE